ncbi:MAG: hypothetical protein JEZ01_20985 [Labilibaculum sp.]|nr:hypothetical protein [Labilibaculum sp.]MBI9060255.1 hypothetical protein [Labilibaculum sp.]
MIVYDEKRKSHANYLMQLIGMKDNDEETVGVRDRSVKAIMKDEKKYNSTEETITSNEKIVFLGRSKTTKSIYENIENKYSKHGIKYGWLGNRALITVDHKMLSKEEYKDFIEEAQLAAKEAEDKIFSHAGTMAGAAGVALGSITPASSTVLFLRKGFKPVLYPVLGVGFVITAILEARKKIKLMREIRTQQYNYAVLSFYSNHLSEFVEK